jgi:glucose/arabinose dehydrogenase
MAVHPGDNAVYVAEKTGKVRALAGGAVALDVSALVVTGSEQGLLGITFSPDGSHLYVNYTERSHGDTRVVEYAFSGGHADPATARQLLAITQPYANHNGGNVITGPDGKLWIGMGDGGSANDPGNRAQNRGELLGKLLRIDPTPSGGQPYTVPPDNPFVGQAGVRGEIWAYGLRNPWRFEFDRANHDLWIADVGQNAWEEIDWRPASSKGGENYGWKCYEGNHQANCPAVSGALLPVEEYSHSATGGCSITGGFVYRGSKIPGLVGAYVYADFCVGRLHAIKLSGGRVSERKDLGVTLENLSSFGQDANGELYALSLGGTVDRIDPA